MVVGGEDGEGKRERERRDYKDFGMRGSMHQKGKTEFYKGKLTWTGPDFNDGHRTSDLGRDHAESVHGICGGFIAVDHAVHHRRIVEYTTECSQSWP